MNGAIAQKLVTLLGEDRVFCDLERRTLYSQDIYTRSTIADFVIRPPSVEILKTAVGCATEDGFAVIGRGGGMSYTSGYVPQVAKSIIIDMSDLNAVVEINTEDMYVTVEAGCTWADLNVALAKTEYRTPFWGPLSGLKATVGGSISQNSVYWGAGAWGASADSVSCMEIVLADGSVLHTSSAAHQRGGPFYRYYGPDLTGLFTCDSGALGIKARITLRLIPRAACKGHFSFDFQTLEQQIAAMSELARRNLVEQIFGVDPGLGAIRAERESVLRDIKSVSRVMGSAESVTQAARSAVKIAWHH